MFMKQIINHSKLGQILHTSISGDQHRCAWKKLALQNDGDNIYGTDAQFPQNRLITNAQKSWTITFKTSDNVGGATIGTPISVVDGDTITPQTPPTISGYTFHHWEPSLPATASSNATYVAVYNQSTPTWTITFNKNVDGVVSLIETRPVQDGQPIGSAPQPTVPNYHFVGYSPSVPTYATQDGTYTAIYSEDEIPESALRHFTTVAKGNGTISFHITDAVDSDPNHSTLGVVDEVSYRTWDGSSRTSGGQKIYSGWTKVQNPKGQTIQVNVLNNTEVEWKGRASGYAIGYYDNTAQQSGYEYQYSYFSSTCNMTIKNNPLTLLYNADADAIQDIDSLWHLDSGSSYCFCGLFAGCTTLTSASDLYFPTYLDSGEHHFCDFFRDCTNLTTASFKCGKREGTMLDSCYERMFLGCSSLTTPPELPSVNLGYTCYQAMFSGCTSLVNAPVLPATTLATGCYDRMFGSYEYYTGNYPACTSLTRIQMAAPYTHDWDGVTQHPLRNWAAGITQTGTFVGDNDWIDDSSIPGNLPASWKQ